LNGERLANGAGEDLIKATVKGFSRVLILWLHAGKSMSGYALSKKLKRLTGWSFHPRLFTHFSTNLRRTVL